MNSINEKSPDLNVLSSDIENTFLEFRLEGFNQKSVSINNASELGGLNDNT